MDELLDEGLRVALHFLEKNREFYPFAVAMTAGGEVQHIQGHIGEERPNSRELIAFTEQALRGLANRGYGDAGQIHDFVGAFGIGSVSPRVRIGPEAERGETAG